MQRLYANRVRFVVSILVLSNGIGIATGDKQLLFGPLEATFAQENASISSTIVANNQSSIVDTFKAHGTISSVAADTLIGSNKTLGSHSADLFVLGGNWSFGVKSGNLSDFGADIVMTKFDGTQRHSHVIENMTNATGAVPPITSDNIILVSNNYTAFTGFVDIGEWKSVSITGNLNNGNLLLLNVDPVKTEHHFKGLPIYGTVASLTDHAGRELRAD